jgi:excisionase family DNA binding protein
VRRAVERATLSVPEAAAVLGISRDAAYDAARRGELPTLRFGRRILVSRAALDRLLNAGEPITK